MIPAILFFPQALAVAELSSSMLSMAHSTGGRQHLLQGLPRASCPCLGCVGFPANRENLNGIYYDLYVVTI